MYFNEVNGDGAGCDGAHVNTVVKSSPLWAPLRLWRPSEAFGVLVVAVESGGAGGNGLNNQPELTK
jgi:hypothetical protein